MAFSPVVHDYLADQEGQGAAVLYEGEAVEAPKIDDQGLGTGGLQGVGPVGGVQEITSGPEDNVSGRAGFRRLLLTH